jgi:hypothetical protein
LKFNVSYRVIKLGLAVRAKKLVVALGNFILAKFNFEIISVFDLPEKQVNKDFLDSADAQDVAAIVPNKGIFNNVGLSDGEKYFAEDYVSGDYTADTQITWVLYKNPLEILVTQDQVTFQHTKFLTENVKATDFLGGEVDKTDKTIDYFDVIGNTSLIADQFERQVNYVRSFSELTSIVESAAISLSRGVTDSSSASDSGSLRSQGYTEDMTYFAEDYVGESRTFT